MNTAVTRLLGIAHPILAFSHSRRVAAEASRLGAFGILGASGYGPDRLDEALTFIDDHCDGAGYGVDFLMPARSADTGTRDPDLLVEELRAQLPDGHRAFVRQVLSSLGVATRPLDAPTLRRQDTQASAASVYPMLDVVFAHDRARLIVNALGPPPVHLVERAHGEGRLVGALCGAPRHAERNLAAGTDLLVAQGTEAAGHSGEIATMVLTPQIVDLAGTVPVLAAGGIASGRQLAAALCLGAAGAWVGSAWLTTAEAEHDDTRHAVDRLLAASSADTVRSRCQSGKPVRQLRSAWSDAWSAPGAPVPLDMPLQQLLISDAIGGDALALQGLGVAGPLVGQVVGQLNSRTTTASVLAELVGGAAQVLEDLGGAAATA